MRKLKAYQIHVIATAVALAAAACVGCKSGSGGGAKEKKVEVAESGDLVEHNRLMVRMAQAENVYNATATERAVYPKDFRPGTATLNELGARRVQTLIDVCRDASGRVAVIRGDETDAVYAARVDAVRNALADAGLSMEQLQVGDGHVNGDTVSSNRALLSFERMMTESGPQAQRPPQGSVLVSPADSSSSRNSK